MDDELPQENAELKKLRIENIALNATLQSLRNAYERDIGRSKKEDKAVGKQTRAAEKELASLYEVIDRQAKQIAQLTDSLAACEKLNRPSQEVSLESLIRGPSLQWNLPPLRNDDGG